MWKYVKFEYAVIHNRVCFSMLKTSRQKNFIFLLFALHTSDRNETLQQMQTCRHNHNRCRQYESNITAQSLTFKICKSGSPKCLKSPSKFCSVESNFKGLKRELVPSFSDSLSFDLSNQTHGITANQYLSSNMKLFTYTFPNGKVQAR